MVKRCTACGVRDRCPSEEITLPEPARPLLTLRRFMFDYNSENDHFSGNFLRRMTFFNISLRFSDSENPEQIYKFPEGVWRLSWGNGFVHLKR